MTTIPEPLAPGLARSERLALLDSIGCGIWAYDGEAIRYVNRALESITGYSREELLRPGFFEDIIIPEYRDLVIERGRARVRGEDVPAQYEISILAKDGTIRELAIHGMYVDLPSGTVSLVSAVDVTALKVIERGANALADAVAAANASLIEADRVKDEILGLVSHELRTPLTTLLGSASLLRRRGEQLTSEQRAEIAADMEAHATRLFSIIENMLALSTSRAREDLQLEPLLLDRVVQQTVAEFRNANPGRRVRFVRANRPAAVIANSTYVRQVVMNLLSNAHKYTPREQDISVRVRAGKETARCCVVDRGSGITEQEIAQVFEPFFRSENNAPHTAGVGLGLTVCQRLVELQGGEISVRNRRGGGTEFCFTLPLMVAGYEGNA